MAIDKNAIKDFLAEIEGLIDVLAVDIPEEVKKRILDKVLGPALEDIREFVEESREPRIMLVGRSGDGKSSLLNALAGKKISEPSNVKPGTRESDEYIITFPEYYSTWKVIDTRGIFDTTRPEGAEEEEEDALKVLTNDIMKHQPDILLHVINMKSLRAFSKDMEAFVDLRKKIKKKTKLEIPSVMVLTHADIIGNPREWPIEDYPTKLNLIQEALDYVTDDILKSQIKSYIDLNFSYKGYIVEDDKYIGIIPVSTLEDSLWNIGTLTNFIGEYLPEEAKLNFFQARNDLSQLKTITTKLIKRFQNYAMMLGANPLPVADILVLTPLQILLIILIGGLAGRKLSMETFYEYLGAVGLNIGVALGAKQAARQLVKLIPGAGMGISAAVAGTATYGIGKSAEAYFLNENVKEAKKFVNIDDEEDCIEPLEEGGQKLEGKNPKFIARITKKFKRK